MNDVYGIARRQCDACTYYRATFCIPTHRDNRCLLPVRLNGVAGVAALPGYSQRPPAVTPAVPPDCYTTLSRAALAVRTTIIQLPHQRALFLSFS